MKLTRTWIDTNLSGEERKQLVDYLLERSQNPTGEAIREALVELFPALENELPSLNSIYAWKNKVWRFELEKRELREQNAIANVLAEAGGDGSMDEANRVMLQALMFDQLRAMREGRAEQLDPECLKVLAKNVTALGRQGLAVKDFQMRHEKHEQEKAEWESQRNAAKAAIARVKNAGLSEEGIREAEEALKLL